MTDTKLTAELLDELEALAKAARDFQPEPPSDGWPEEPEKAPSWSASGGWLEEGGHAAFARNHEYSDDQESDGANVDAAFVAALSPDVVLSLISAARASLDSRGDVASGEVLEVGSTRGGKFKVTLTCSRDESKEWGQLLYKRVSASVVTGATRPPTEQREHIHDPLTMGPRFTCGPCAKLAPSAAGAESMAGWVSVSERKPNPDDTVLAWGPDWSRGGIASMYEDGSWLDVETAYRVTDITHWMPLPSPPEPTNGR